MTDTQTMIRPSNWVSESGDDDHLVVSNHYHKVYQEANPVPTRSETGWDARGIKQFNMLLIRSALGTTGPTTTDGFDHELVEESLDLLGNGPLPKAVKRYYSATPFSNAWHELQQTIWNLVQSLDHTELECRLGGVLVGFAIGMGGQPAILISRQVREEQIPDIDMLIKTCKQYGFGRRAPKPESAAP